jgi:hypothetical protein
MDFSTGSTPRQVLSLAQDCLVSGWLAVGSLPGDDDDD